MCTLHFGGTNSVEDALYDKAIGRLLVEFLTLIRRITF